MQRIPSTCFLLSKRKYSVFGSHLLLRSPFYCSTRVLGVLVAPFPGLSALEQTRPEPLSFRCLRWMLTLRIGMSRAPLILVLVRSLSVIPTQRGIGSRSVSNRSKSSVLYVLMPFRIMKFRSGFFPHLSTVLRSKSLRKSGCFFGPPTVLWPLASLPRTSTEHRGSAYLSPQWGTAD